MTSSSFSLRHNLKIFILKNLTKNCFNKQKILLQSLTKQFLDGDQIYPLPPVQIGCKTSPVDIGLTKSWLRAKPDPQLLIFHSLSHKKSLFLRIFDDVNPCDLRFGSPFPNKKSWFHQCIKPCAMCVPDTGCCIFLLLRAASRMVAYNIAKMQNIR